MDHGLVCNGMRYPLSKEAWLPVIAPLYDMLGHRGDSVGDVACDILSLCGRTSIVYSNEPSHLVSAWAGSGKCTLTPVSDSDPSSWASSTRPAGILEWKCEL